MGKRSVRECKICRNIGANATNPNFSFLVGSRETQVYFLAETRTALGNSCCLIPERMDSTTVGEREEKSFSCVTTSSCIYFSVVLFARRKVKIEMKHLKLLDWHFPGKRKSPTFCWKLVLPLMLKTETITNFPHKMAKWNLALLLENIPLSVLCPIELVTSWTLTKTVIKLIWQLSISLLYSG